MNILRHIICVLGAAKIGDAIKFKVLKTMVLNCLVLGLKWRVVCKNM